MVSVIFSCKFWLTCYILSLPFENRDITTEKIIAGIFAVAVYFIPTIIGRDKKARLRIFLFNLTAGWTGIGWMIALIWAIKSKNKTTTVLTYTDALPEDATFLSEVAVASKKVWGYPDDLMQLWKTDLEVTPEYIADNEVIKVFDRETFIGFYAIKMENDKTAELDHFWIIPDHIRQNYGRKIFDQIATSLSVSGVSKMTLIAEPNAKGFYEKMGGKVLGQFESKVKGRFLDIYEYRIETSDPYISD